MMDKSNRLRGCTVIDIKIERHPPVFFWPDIRVMTPGGSRVISHGMSSKRDLPSMIRGTLSSYSHAFFTAAEYGVASMAFPTNMDAWVPSSTGTTPWFRIMLKSTCAKSIVEVRSIFPTFERGSESITSYGPDFAGGIVVGPTISSWIDEWVSRSCP